MPADLARDELDDVLDVASEIVAENAPCPANTRIERLSRWLESTLGGLPYAAVLDDGTRMFRARDVRVTCADGAVTLYDNRMSPAHAREVAIALVRAAEVADRGDA